MSRPSEADSYPDADSRENAVHGSRVVAFSFHERFQNTVACTGFLVSTLASRRLQKDGSSCP